MTTALITHRVADYDAWRPEYDRVMASPLASGVRSSLVLRGQEDRNLVVVAQAFDSREAAEATFSSPELREAMARGGVDEASLKIQYCDEVDSRR